MKKSEILDKVVKYLDLPEGYTFGYNHELLVELKSYIAYLKNRDKEVINLFNSLKIDAKMALNGKWDRSDDGFECQIGLIEGMLTKLKKK